jgi:hypothetical protein
MLCSTEFVPQAGHQKYIEIVVQKDHGMEPSRRKQDRTNKICCENI